MGGISISQIREAKLKSGMTEQQVDAEMNGLLIKISEQDSGINQNYKPEPTNTQHITRKTELVTHTDPLIEAQWKMRERLSETSRRDYPVSVEYANEMRRKAMGSEDDRKI